MTEHPTLASTLTRFLTQSGHFSRENHRVKERAFLPDPYDALSVFGIDGLDDDGIWGLCAISPLHGRGDILARVATDIGLSVEPDNDPPRHVCIIGWPTEKPKRKLLAQKLASEARLVLRPENR